MPPASYLWLHLSARLSDAERLVLIQGLDATFGIEGAGSEEDEDSHDDRDEDD